MGEVAEPAGRSPVQEVLVLVREEERSLRMREGEEDGTGEQGPKRAAIDRILRSTHPVILATGTPSASERRRDPEKCSSLPRPRLLAILSI